MQTKTVTVEIPPDVRRELMQSAYRLCFAKKVNESFNVVWQSYDNYFFNNNTFSWAPVYQLFGSDTFQFDVPVRVTTTCVDIGLGEQTTLCPTGIFGKAVPGGPSTGLTIINQSGSVHPGVNQVSVGNDGTQSKTPIYVAEKAIGPGRNTLTPTDEVMVWFQQDIVTSTMIGTAPPKHTVIDLTQADEATILFDGDTWSAPRRP